MVATEVARLHLSSPPDHAKRVQKPSGQIEAFDLARTRTPSSRHERKNQKTSCFTLILLTPEVAAVGRVAFSSGESAFKSLVFIGGEVMTGGRKAESEAVFYD